MSSADQEVTANGPAMRGGTVDRVVGHLRDGIINSRYAPGQRLIEADLTREMGVSRGPLREAFRRLAAEGLLEIVPNRGAFVRRLSFREMTELFQIRIALEALAVRCAALAIEEDDNRTRFEAAIAPIWNDAPRLSGAAYHEENRLFHQAIFNICGNLQLAEVASQLQLPLIMLQLSGVMTGDMYADSVAEHRAIATAILKGEPDTAEEVLRRHLDRAAKIVEEMPRAIFRS